MSRPIISLLAAALVVGLLCCPSAKADKDKAAVETGAIETAPADEYPRSLGLPPYPGSDFVPMDGQLSTGGTPLDALIFATKDPVARVMAFYENNLTTRDLKVAKHYFGPQAGYIGFFHAKSKTMRLANVRATPQGTMIVLSAMNPMPLMEKRMSIPDDLPTLPGASNVVNTETKQGTVRNRTVYFEISGTPGEVTDDIIKAAQDKEWTARKASRNDLLKDGITLKRGRETCIIRVAEASDTKTDKPSSTVTMVVIEEHSPEGSKSK